MINERNPHVGSLVIGALLVLAGIGANELAVEALLVPDKTLTGLKNLIVLYSLQATFIVTGLWLVWRRPRFRAPILSKIFGAGLIVVITVGFYGTVRALLPAPWKADNLSMVERLVLVAEHSEGGAWNPGIGKYRMLLKLPFLENSVYLRRIHAVGLLDEGRTADSIVQFEWIRDRMAKYPNEDYPVTKKEIQDYIAIAYLRMGEQANCVAGKSNSVCFFPIRSEGIHSSDWGSRAAVKEFETALRNNPEDLTTRWLLNIAYMTLGEHPEKVPSQWLIPTELFKSEYEVGRFYDVAPRLGLDVIGTAGGSIIEDFDQDGFLDVMTSSRGVHEQLRYFRNNGDGTFTDHTKKAGLVGQRGGLNINHADYNNDGYPDVLVLRGGWEGYFKGSGDIPNSLLRNNGDGTFTDATEETGLLSFHPTQTAAWGDFDNDGWLDLYIGNETRPNDDNHPSQLFHNDGSGHFTEITSKVGLDIVGLVKGVAWGDYDNDGLLDLYVSRYRQSNLLFRNDGNSNGSWSFTDVTNLAGVGAPSFSFPVWFFDYNNDGWLDIFVAGYGSKSNAGDPAKRKKTSAYGFYDDVPARYLGISRPGTQAPVLYRNNGDGTFKDVAKETRLDRSAYVMGANYGDVDNDGFLDIYLGTGGPSFRALMPNLMFRNNEGKIFQDITTSAGVGHLQKGHGIAFGDIDNDGDQDIYAEFGGRNVGDIFQNVLFQNPGNDNHWITLRLEGTRSNRAAIGTRIKITVDTANGPRDLYSNVDTGGTFGSSSLQQEIGLGQALGIRSIQITWPASGTVQQFDNVAMDQIVIIRENQPNVIVAEYSPIKF